MGVSCSKFQVPSSKLQVTSYTINITKLQLRSLKHYCNLKSIVAKTTRMRIGPSAVLRRTVRHMVLDCKGLPPAFVKEETDPAMALGSAMEDGLLDFKRVMQTKQKLGEWWMKLREG